MDAFRMVVVAVVTLAVLYIIYGFFANPFIKAEEQFRTGLDYAEGISGKYYRHELRLEKGGGANASALDTRSRSVRFECNEADCENLHVSLRPRIATFTENIIVDAYFRCVDKGIINDCVVYFGAEPAQLMVENAAFEAGTGTLGFAVKNTGKLDAVDSTWQIRIYAKQKQGAEEKLALKKEFSGQITKIGSLESTTIAQQVALGDGAYVARIAAFGEDAGSSTAEKEFGLSGGISGLCRALSKGLATMEGGICRTKYICTGCGSGAECKVRWLQGGLDESSIAEIYPDGVYAEQPAVNGECQ